MCCREFQNLVNSVDLCAHMIHIPEQSSIQSRFHKLMHIQKI